MITNILDTIIAQAADNNWTIKYIAMDKFYMRELVAEVTAFAGQAFKVETLSSYKDVKLAVKDFDGMQVAYAMPDVERLIHPF